MYLAIFVVAGRCYLCIGRRGGEKGFDTEIAHYEKASKNSDGKAEEETIAEKRDGKKGEQEPVKKGPQEAG